MSYQQKNNQIWEEMGERMELVAERLTQIAEGTGNSGVAKPEAFGAAAGIADAEDCAESKPGRA
jgi:hypothetical protein